MNDSSIASTLIGYAPIVDPKRNAIATRLSVRPADGSEVSLDALYAEMSATFPESGTPVLISLEGGRPTAAIADVPANPGVWLELAADFVCDPASRDLIATLQARGFKLVLSGRPSSPLPDELVPAFSLALIHVGEDRRLQSMGNDAKPSSVKRTIPYAQVGVQSIAMMERCFATGAQAVIGWPFDDALKHAQSASTNPDFTSITRLISLIEKGEDVVHMEALIRRDAALAYRLLRYINSPAFGLRIEIQSFRHAVMMLGYTKLKRWLMLLLATSCKDANMRPLMFASFRRGLFLEHLIGASEDESLRDEVFILGVFSLLDKMFKESFEKLFASLHVPERVQETLVNRSGGYMPYLRIAEAVEQGPGSDLDDKLADAVISRERCNQAVVRAVLTPDAIAA